VTTNGTIANGHQLVPLAMPLQQRGDVSAMPQDDPGQSRTEPDKPGRWARAMSASRRNWWRLVFAAVAAVAAVVSYGHIVSLFLSWHATSLDAHLMPIAIDGLIIIGAGAAKGGQKRLGWSAIGPGLAASLYANVMNGLPYGRGAAMGSGWATVALFLATNVMERWKAAPPAEAIALPAIDAPVVTPRRDSDDDTKDDKPRKPAARKRVTAVTNKELADREGVSVRTLQRRRNGSKP
jgi:hypothetical protein